MKTTINTDQTPEQRLARRLERQHGVTPLMADLLAQITQQERSGQ